MSDPEDLDALERRLAAADFSADSRVRAGLRARLLRRRASPLPRPGAARALVLAACLLALLAPALRRALRAPAEPSFSYPLGEEGLPVLPGRFDSAAARAAAPVFEVARGREILLENGRAVEWNLPGASFRLETRRIAPEDIFDKPRMRGEL